MKHIKKKIVSPGYDTLLERAALQVFQTMQTYALPN